MEISVYIPIRNNVNWCRTVPLLPRVRYIASDNFSTDGTGEVLRERGVEVIRQEQDLGRVGNWAFCVRHFVDSGATWMKWLFAGDVLAENFPDVASRAATAWPAARMIVGDNVHVDDGRSFYYKMMPRTRLLQPHESLQMLARDGNWFYSPINQMFHREALAGGFDFGPFDWAADAYFCMNVAAAVPVLYWAESFGEFHVAERANFRSQGESLRALLETALVREMAAHRLDAMGGAAPQHAGLSSRVEAEILRRLLARRLRRSKTGSLLLAAVRVLRGAASRRPHGGDPDR